MLFHILQLGILLYPSEDISTIISKSQVNSTSVSKFTQVPCCC